MVFSSIIFMFTFLPIILVTYYLSPRKLRKSLNLKHNDYVVTTLVLGYPDVRYRRTAQKERANVRFL